MKVRSWIIALLGLWEAGDIAALITPGFGEMPAFLWNHILTGILLIIAGIWAARARNADTARALHWIAAAAGAWLVAASFLLRSPAASPGVWNDIIVGAVVVILAAWSVFAARRVDR